MIHSKFRYAHHPDDVRNYTTKELREHFLIPELFKKDEINLTYSMYDRFIVGGAFPADKAIKLETIDDLKSENFLDRRELGIINVGGKGKVIVEGEEYELANKVALLLLITFIPQISLWLPSLFD